MTYDDDFCRIQFISGTRDIPCKSLNLDWPPPEKIDIYGFRFVREQLSRMSDEDRASCPLVVRGALYVPAEG